MTKEYLNESEVQKIEQFCADKEMYNAVRKVVLQGIYQHGTVQKDQETDPLINGAFNLAAVAQTNPVTDELLGQHIRGMWAGVNAMKNAFDDLDSIKSDKPKEIESPFNIAE